MLTSKRLNRCFRLTLIFVGLDSKLKPNPAAQWPWRAIELLSGGVNRLCRKPPAAGILFPPSLRLCFGIYDTKCDGASEESPVKLIKAGFESSSRSQKE